MGYYRIAQICLNGHCITSSVDASPELAQKFCDQCGSTTITTCPSCRKSIRGEYFVPGFSWIQEYKVPPYCHECGKPFPWTQAAIEAAADLIIEESEFDEDQRNRLVSSLPDIITETPRTQVAVVRLKKALLSAGKFTADGLRQFALDFGCELAKRQLGL